MQANLKFFIRVKNCLVLANIQIASIEEQTTDGPNLSQLVPNKTPNAYLNELQLVGKTCFEEMLKMTEKIAMDRER